MAQPASISTDCYACLEQCRGANPSEEIVAAPPPRRAGVRAHLGHLLLVQLLPQVTDRGRVVFTASGTHDPDTLNGRLAGKTVEPGAVALAYARTLSAGKRYSTSKLCTAMYAYGLDRRLRKAGSAISSVAYDSGAVPETGFLREMPRPVQRLPTSAATKTVSGRIGVITSDVDEQRAAKLWDDSRRLVRLTADEEPAPLR
ncbi:hypothetical protein Aab01nite_76880 [Paractinoplanes abujensis]|uniref:NAD(P)-dependent dehydrogenase (Short-subunit alcohol dehydrogenase family) n=1 Tax=Paractinoplanes abujensis TaxID=882441 RepID=A0A7W7G1R3_9ACTN|nr:hypothetical protein [Actinoplanes abujensis]MBB4692425.1 NAD(P)-dependent dehydrogenase (short-subunit alcohol dehydrogenase family) [Actinoplanes abujensis]GID24098.1 hypothetical protein Aab01nite_76880 [Actinoplanes abujensis]